jgi:meso-butanediol dehydrogenase / (S,S)-butanediol dehydrogenase / diacetyl reductase
MMKSINPVAIITGGAKGIGFGIAQRFLDEKYSIVILDKDEIAMDAIQDWSRQNDCLILKCDVSNPEQVETSISKVITHFGRLDVLINNAGIAIFKEALKITYEDWNAIMATNLNGTFICTQACIPHMLVRGKGAIVNIASISGVRASTLRIAYGTSKAAIMHLTKQQAVEYGNQGIRVNAIAPGPVDTDMAKLVHSADIRTSYNDAIPLARYGTIDEIANAVYFLCSDQASYINGQILCVDGGFDAAGVGLPSLRN